MQTMSQTFVTVYPLQGFVVAVCPDCVQRIEMGGPVRLCDVCAASFQDEAPEIPFDGRPMPGPDPTSAWEDYGLEPRF